MFKALDVTESADRTDRDQQKLQHGDPGNRQLHGVCKETLLHFQTRIFGCAYSTAFRFTPRAIKLNNHTQLMIN